MLACFVIILVTVARDMVLILALFVLLAILEKEPYVLLSVMIMNS